MKENDSTRTLWINDLPSTGPDMLRSKIQSLLEQFADCQCALLFGLPMDRVQRLGIGEYVRHSTANLLVLTRLDAKTIARIWQETNEHEETFVLCAVRDSGLDGYVDGIPTERRVPWGTVPEKIVSEQANYVSLQRRDCLLLSKYYEGASLALCYLSATAFPIEGIVVSLRK